MMRRAAIVLLVLLASCSSTGPKPADLPELASPQRVRRGAATAPAAPRS